MSDATDGTRSGGSDEPDGLRFPEGEEESPGDRVLRAELQSLPLEASLPRDLWPEIRGRLQPRTPAGAGGAAGGQGVPMQPARFRRGGRLSLSWGQAAAAGVALMLLSGSVVWVGLRGSGTGATPAGVAGGASGTPAGAGSVPAAVADPLEMRFATAEEAFGEYDLAVSDLRRIVEEASGRLEPGTVRVLEENLATVEAALAEAREALLADPSGEMMGSLLSGTMRRRLGVLRQAVTMAVAQS